MIWQDYAFTGLLCMFVVVTIPLVIDVIKGKTTVNLMTAGPTAFGNYGMMYLLATLGLWISVTSSALISTLWLIIFIFSWRNNTK